MLVLETLEHAQARGARVYAELAGYGATSDAYHPTQPAPAHEGGQRSMRLALEDAGLAPADIGYINAHGTGTDIGDVAGDGGGRGACSANAAARWPSPRPSR